eukprot:TRINITY_DN5567_c0_g1_i2.p1 TRINITY_DN5567_c0_g1~~TRINITY_DN5567_c0_g1_i2.p1  ORF type:complete len:182 (+),score=44.24 TRINITY_DN5567_c0_g1_i2:99-644(+)
MSIHLLGDHRLDLNSAVLALGLLILLLGLLRELLNSKVPGSTIMFAMMVGVILGPYALNIVNFKENVELYQVIFLEVSHLVIAVQLMATALSVPFSYLQKAVKIQLLYLIPLLIAMWLASGLVVHGILSMTPGMKPKSIWTSMLIGACVAPTDPVLASAVSGSQLAIRYVPGRVRYTSSAA